MSTEPQRDRITVVLVSPRNPLNIGAVARAMANFGFTRLSVVAPFDPHWQEAKSAIGAAELLENAQRAETLAEAVADCTLVLGTSTLEHRKAEQPVLALPDLAALVREELLRDELARGGRSRPAARNRRAARIALVFGPEKRGLTREDLAHCHRVVEIPTDPHQPSMNLGQAVAVCLYELSTRLFAPAASRAGPTANPATAQISDEEDSCGRAVSAQLEMLAGVIAETMVAAHYSPPAMRAANGHDLRLLLRRMVINERDARRILGLFRRILHRLKTDRAELTDLN